MLLPTANREGGSSNEVSGAIVLYVCKRERRENPKEVIMIDRFKARVRENPKKRDRTIRMYSAKIHRYVLRDLP